nr:frizzled-1-like protein [Procambarus clarkii]
MFTRAAVSWLSKAVVCVVCGVALLGVDGVSIGTSSMGSSTCEPISVPMCINELPYNATCMPNIFDHTTQDEARFELRKYRLMLEHGCSSALRELACSVYLPACTASGQVLLPCRSLCLAAWADCESTMNLHDMSWPQELDCDKFPDGPGEGLCMEGRKIYSENSENTFMATVKDMAPPIHSSTVNSAAVAVSNTHSGEHHCEANRVPMCSDLPYNTTRLPNALHHKTQEQASSIVLFLLPVMMSECSPDLRLLVCSIFVPPCASSEKERLPCRSLCASVRSGCEGLMNRFNIPWPSELVCDMLPSGPNDGCVGGNVESTEDYTLATTSGAPYNPPEEGRDLNTQVAPAAGTCEAITAPMCHTFSHATHMPNTFNHSSQEEVQVKLRQLWPLLESQCSPDLRLFLCTLYLPPCTPLEESIPPCRSMCESVYVRCSNVLDRLGVAWPVACDDLSDEGSCVTSNNTQAVDAPAGGSVSPTPTPVSLSSSLQPLATHHHIHDHWRCEHTLTGLCRGLYNSTFMPNLFQHSSREADHQLHMFLPLIEAECSPNILAFLCTAYIPPCTSLQRPAPPCRSFCLTAKKGCDQLVDTMGLQWPDALKCSNFPEYNMTDPCSDETFEIAHGDAASITEDSLPVTQPTALVTSSPPAVPGIVGFQKFSAGCEFITEPMCHDMPYNTTIMSGLSHSSTEVASLKLHEFFPLVKMKCSPDLQLLVCSFYVPICTTLERPPPPCRSLCVSARQGCERLMNQYGFMWPQELECGQFPADQREQLCVDNSTFLSV